MSMLLLHSQEKGKTSSIRVTDGIYWNGKVQPKGENNLLQKIHFALALPESIKIHPYFFLWWR